MPTSTGFSCPYITLAVGLRFAQHDFETCGRTLDRSSIIHAIEIPRARAYVVVLLNAALCEATINTALALEFGAADWETLERRSTVAKWSEVPKRIWPAYSLSAPLLDELKALFACRDSIMHSKAEVFDGHAQLHAGNFPGRRSADYAVIRRSFDLSLRLLNHLQKYDSRAWLHYVAIREELTRTIGPAA